jgi:predicted SAM-dependent methyltransferase
MDLNKIYNEDYFLKSRGFQTSKWRVQRFFIFVKEYKHDKVLDVGCGMGTFVNYLRENRIEAFGVDGAEAAQKYWNKDYFKLANANKIPFKDGVFDLVTSTDFFEHVEESEIDGIYSEMKRVVKPKGTILNFIAPEVKLKAYRDIYHCTNKPLGWWRRKLSGSVVVDSNTLLEKRLNLGSGPRKMRGYTNIDIEKKYNPDIVADVRKINVKKADEVRAHHLLEHFDMEESIKVLRQWKKWLKKDGKLVIETPDFERTCKYFDKSPHWVEKGIYGSQEAEWAFHRSGWYEAKFKKVLTDLGFRIDTIHKGFSRAHCPSIKVVAFKLL